MGFERLFRILQTLTAPERRRLRKYVSSPYFLNGKKADNLLHLLDISLEWINQPANSSTNVSTLPQVFFTGTPLPNRRLEKYIAELHQHVLNFLSMEENRLHANELEKQLRLARSFQKRQLLKYSDAALTEARQILAQAATGGAIRYLYQVQLCVCEVDQQIMQAFKTPNLPFNEAFEALYLFYQISKMDLTTSASAFSDRFEFKPSELTLHILKEQPFAESINQENPLLYLGNQYNWLSASKKPDLPVFEQLVFWLKKNEVSLLDEDKKRGWAILRNILLIWFNASKNPDIGMRYLEVARDNMANGHLYYHDKILPQTLESVVKVALMLGYSEVALEILQEHKNKIAGETEDDAYFRYNLARYHFYTGSQEKALDALPQKIPDTSVQQFIRVLELQILYELNSELFPYRMDAFRLFLNRNISHKVNPERLHALRLFLNALARLYRCPNGNILRAKTIISQIQANSDIFEYQWLLKKAQEKGRLEPSLEYPQPTSD
ncbi:MAG: hypothetical protein JNJ90_00515 [Saprospiraceae bacterium]|jgi:hypothetical protein|nr:hypothetical protein [Saprospiraceae bacterium]